MTAPAAEASWTAATGSFARQCRRLEEALTASRTGMQGQVCWGVFVPNDSSAFCACHQHAGYSIRCVHVYVYIYIYIYIHMIHIYVWTGVSYMLPSMFINQTRRHDHKDTGGVRSAGAPAFDRLRLGMSDMFHREINLSCTATRSLMLPPSTAAVTM